MRLVGSYIGVDAQGCFILTGRDGFRQVHNLTTPITMHNIIIVRIAQWHWHCPDCCALTHVIFQACAADIPLSGISLCSETQPKEG